MSLRFFEGAEQAKFYAAARPRYSDNVFDRIFNFCQAGGGKFRLAVDVACGTGHQSTLPLLDRFENVIGVDVSEEQLKQTPKNVANLEFRQSAAENLSFLDPNSVDLVTAASSFHWFNIPEFLTEVERVLSPGGCLAVYTYGWPSLPEPAARNILEKFISTCLAEFYHAGNLMSIAGYKDVTLPFQDSQRETMTLEMDWTVGQLCDFFQSTSVWQKRRKVSMNMDSLKHEYDNAPVHKSRVAQAAYSSDLAQSDYFLFRNLKSALRGRHFWDDEDVKAATEAWLWGQPEDFYKSGIKSLKEK